MNESAKTEWNGTLAALMFPNSIPLRKALRLMKAIISILFKMNINLPPLDKYWLLSQTRYFGIKTILTNKRDGKKPASQFEKLKKSC